LAEAEGDMRLFMLVLLALLMSGCSIFDHFWDKEVLEKYAPQTVRSQQRENLIQALNSYLEKPKAERVRIAGPPDKCTNQNSAEENCEWIWISNSTKQSVSYTFGSGGLAKSWSYYGYYGQFTSANYAAVKSGTTSQAEADRSQEKSWAHAFKTDSQFEQDALQCRTEVQTYPRAVWDIETDKCLKRNGWTQREKR
jgi:hypothetical protein